MSTLGKNLVTTRMNFSNFMALSTHSSTNEDTTNSVKNIDSWFKLHEDQHRNLDLGFDDDESSDKCSE